MRNEVIVRDRIRGKMRKVAQAEGSQRARLCRVVNLEADLPRVAMPAGDCVLLRDARIGSDGAVQEIASPRKMCVPGVQAWALPGTRMSARSTASAIAHGAARPPRIMRRVVLDTDLLALAADRLAQILQLVGDDVVDRFASVIHVFADLLRHVVERNALDEIAPFVSRRAPAALRVRRCPTRALDGAPARPARACQSGRAAYSGTAAGELEHRPHRPAPGRTAAEEQRDARSDRRSEKRGGEEIELLLTLRVRLLLLV
jgi:hypothetical protein